MANVPFVYCGAVSRPEKLVHKWRFSATSISGSRRGKRSGRAVRQLGAWGARDTRGYGLRAQRTASRSARSRSASLNEAIDARSRSCASATIRSRAMAARFLVTVALPRRRQATSSICSFQSAALADSCDSQGLKAAARQKPRSRPQLLRPPSADPVHVWRIG